MMPVKSPKFLNTALVILLIPAILMQLSACAESPKTESNDRGPVTILTESNLGEWVSSSYFEPCGNPVEWKEVRVIWPESENPSRRVHPSRVHDEILKYERNGWMGYWVSSSQTHAVQLAQKAFADQGCNLLIIGDIFSIQQTNYVTHVNQTPGNRTEVFLIRWGRDDTRVN